MFDTETEQKWEQNNNSNVKKYDKSEVVFLHTEVVLEELFNSLILLSWNSNQLNMVTQLRKH